MAITFHVTSKNSVAILIGVCVVALAVIPLVASAHSLELWPLRSPVIGVGVLAVIALLLQSHMQSKDDDARAKN